MSDKKNKVRKKSALARRRAGKINGLKGGYSGFREYRKNPENKSLRQRSDSQKASHTTRHSTDKHNTGDHDPRQFIVFEEVKSSEDSLNRTRFSTVGVKYGALDSFENNSSDNDKISNVKSEPTDDAVSNSANAKQNKRRRKQQFTVRC